jgi:predicted nucleic acid-binding protein
MPDIVVDASAIAAMVFAEPRGHEVASAIGARRMVAPPLLWHELTNVCIQKMRRHPDDADRYARRFARVQDMQIEARPVNHLAVLSIARETGLTGYDASYLWLARHLDAELVTLDEELRQAAEA